MAFLAEIGARSHVDLPSGSPEVPRGRSKRFLLCGDREEPMCCGALQRVTMGGTENRSNQSYSERCMLGGTFSSSSRCSSRPMRMFLISVCPLIKRAALPRLDHVRLPFRKARR